MPYGGHKLYDLHTREPRREIGKETVSLAKGNGATEGYTAASNNGERQGLGVSTANGKKRTANNDKITPAQKEEKPPQDKETTHFRLVRVPKDVKLSTISEVIEGLTGDKPKDAYWFGRDSVHAVLEMKNKLSVTKLLKNSTLKILDHEVKIVPFYVSENN
ncbi:unnamed protein product [Phytomonas sp. Hart1]|nr:unnamed protein product [Phytomonas sp. Hart1]|eukprot:CCW71813.1 unnamed protein product [Phytomonas sp. isolate Hart1]